MQDVEAENRALRSAAVKAQDLLRSAVLRLNERLRDKSMLEDTAIEITEAMVFAVENMNKGLRALDAVVPQKSPEPTLRGGPTRQQGQFLAYIREYMMRNYAGVAPTHAALQKFFDLTPPSVNSMLIRLERLGFIRRVPHQARSIELTIEASLIPPLNRPFKS